MATPEENTLLALRLFSPIASQVQSGNQNRVALLSRLAQIQNQQAFDRQQLAAKQSFQSDYLTRGQLGSQALEAQRAKNEMDREQARLQNERTLATEAETRQKDVSKQAQDAADLHAIHSAFATKYPLYAQAATALGAKVRPIGDFAQTWEGVGDLGAEQGSLAELAKKKTESETASSLVAPLELAHRQTIALAQAGEAAASLTQDDRDTIQQGGVAAVSKALTMGIPGVKDDVIKAAIGKLSAETPDTDFVSRLKGGAEILSIYNQGRQGAAIAVQKNPERLARLKGIAQQLTMAQRGEDTLQADIVKAGALNPEVGPALSALVGRWGQPAAAAPTGAGAAPGGTPAAKPSADSVFGAMTARQGGGAGGSWDDAAPAPTADSAVTPAAPAAPAGVPAPAVGAFTMPAATPSSALQQFNPATGGLIRSAGEVNANRSLQALKNLIATNFSISGAAGGQPMPVNTATGQPSSQFWGGLGGNATPTEAYWNQIRATADDPRSPQRLDLLDTAITLARARGETIPADIASEFGIGTPAVGGGQETAAGRVPGLQQPTNENDQLAQILGGGAVPSGGASRAPDAAPDLE